MKSDLEIRNDSLAASRKGLVDQQRSKQLVLDQTKGQERAYQKLLSQQQNLQGELEKEIFDIETELNKKLGNKRLPSIKGLIAWPMDGVLTQGYGNTGFTKLGYTFHNGIDVAGPAGTPIYAVADGVVEDTDMNQNASYGNWVTVRHTIQTKAGPHQLISLYAHMTSFRVRKGQALKAGDLIGFEGNTGNTTRLLYGPGRGYHIHFGLYDADGYGVTTGAYTKTYGPYRIPYGATYNPLEYL
ncbi:MAG: M23 family metallopeptidase [Candidatus Saccharibacteria bacterium]